MMPPDAGRNCGEKYGSEATCTLQAVMLQFGGTASVLFGTALAIVFLLLTRTHSREAHAASSRMEKTLQLVVWIVSVVSALIFIPFDLYHPAGPICHVSEQIEVCDNEDPDHCWYVYSGNSGPAFNILLENIPVVLAVFLPVVVCVLMNIVIIGFIYVHMRKIEARIKETSQSRRLSMTTRQSVTARETTLDQSSKVAVSDVDAVNGSEGSETDGGEETFVSSESQQQRRRSIMVAKQGIWYIVGFFGTFGLSFVSGTYYVINDESNKALENWSYFFLALQGFWNFIIFSRRRDMKTSAGIKARVYVWNQGFGAIPFYKMSVGCLTKTRSLCGKDTGQTRENADAGDSVPGGPNNQELPLNTPTKKNNLRGDPASSDIASESETPSQYNSKVSWKSSLVSELGSSRVSIGGPGQDWGDTVHTQDRSPAKPNRCPSDVFPNSELMSEEDSEQDTLPEESNPATPQESAPSTPNREHSDIGIDPNSELSEGESVSSQDVPFVLEEKTLSTITNSVTESEAAFWRRQRRRGPSDHISLGGSIHPLSTPIRTSIKNLIQGKVGNPMKEPQSVKTQKDAVFNLIPKALPTTPSRENRTISELSDSIGCYDSEEHHRQAAASISDIHASQRSLSPAMPLRVASEIEEQALPAASNLCLSQRSCPPEMPTRVASETW